MLIQQSWTQQITPPPATQAARKKKHRHAASRRRTAPRQSSYSGRVNLPPKEQTIDSIEPESSSAATPGLRISSEPMGPVAAQAQARFAAETDSQLTEGWAARALPYSSASSQANRPAVPAVAAPTVPGASSATTGQYKVAQYTPSAQEAATGAYSVPRKDS